MPHVSAERSSSGETDEVEKTFRRFDEDGNNLLDARELELALESLGMAGSEGWATRVMKRCDADGLGMLGLAKFRMLVVDLRRYKRDQRSRSESQPAADAAVTDTNVQEASSDKIAPIFARFDTNRNGLLDVDELQAAMQTLGKNVHYEQAVALMNRYDTERQGQLGLDDFRSLVLDLITASQDESRSMAAGDRIVGLKLQQMMRSGIVESSLDASSSAGSRPYELPVERVPMEEPDGSSSVSQPIGMNRDSSKTPKYPTLL